MTDAALPAAFLAVARAHIGTRFYHGGRSPHGLDCIGLLVVAAQGCGIELADNVNYTSAYVDTEALREYLERYCSPIQDGSPIEDGDIGLFNIAGNPQHCAILTQSGSMIHAYQSAGKVVEHPLDHHWEKRLAVIYRSNSRSSPPAGPESAVPSLNKLDAAIALGWVCHGLGRYRVERAGRRAFTLQVESTNLVPTLRVLRDRWHLNFFKIRKHDETSASIGPLRSIKLAEHLADVRQALEDPIAGQTS